MISIRLLCQPAQDGELAPRFTAAWEFLSIAEGDELLRIDDDGFDDDASARQARLLGLCKFLPFVEAGRELVPVVHDLPDAIVVFAAKPRGKVGHRSSSLKRLGRQDKAFRDAVRSSLKLGATGT